jgi:hypothetical protein
LPNDPKFEGSNPAADATDRKKKKLCIFRVEELPCLASRNDPFYRYFGKELVVEVANRNAEYSPPTPVADGNDSQ